MFLSREMDATKRIFEEMSTASIVAAVASSACGYLGLIYLLRRRLDAYRESLPWPTDANTAHLNCFQMYYMEFPTLSIKALEFGLFKTYAIPSISKLLVATGELTDRCARRYDDTDLIMRTMTENSSDSVPAQLAIRRLNALHSKYPQITNEDYVYVLCIFAVEPLRWIDKYGYRRTSEKEKAAAASRWTDIGIKMGIKGIPATWEAMDQLVTEYELQNMKFVPHNKKLADALLRLFQSTVPSILHPALNQIVYALCDERLRVAMDFPEPNPHLTHFIELVLHLSGWVVKYLMPPRILPAVRTQLFDKSFCPFSPARGVATCPYGSIGTFSGDREGVRSIVDFELKLSEVSSLTLHPRFHVYERTYSSGYRIDKLGPTSHGNDGATLMPLGKPTKDSILQMEQKN